MKESDFEQIIFEISDLCNDLKGKNNMLNEVTYLSNITALEQRIKNKE